MSSRTPYFAFFALEEKRWSYSLSFLFVPAIDTIFTSVMLQKDKIFWKLNMKRSRHWISFGSCQSSHQTLRCVVPESAGSSAARPAILTLFIHAIVICSHVHVFFLICPSILPLSLLFSFLLNFPDFPSANNSVSWRPRYFRIVSFLEILWCLLVAVTRMII